MSSFANFLKAAGAVASVVITTAVEAQVKQHGQQAAMNAEQQEAAKWESRKAEAFANIELGLVNDTSMKRFSGMTSKQEKAVELRAEVTQHCRNRSESMMTYTEKRITEFQLSRW
jgi:hypothetical protein